MRSKLILWLLTLVAVPLSASPFLGKWKMDLVGAPNAYILEFLDDSTLSLVEVNVNDQQYLDYTIDEKNKTINLGTINNTELNVRYSFNSALDTFSLYFRDEMIDNELIGAMGFDKTDDSDNPVPMTAFTQDFVNKFKKGFSDLMKSIPIAVGKKLKQ